MKDPAADIVRQIDGFLRRTGMKESRLGRNVSNNTELVKRIRAGNVKLGTIRKVQAYIAGYSSARRGSDAPSP